MNPCTQPPAEAGLFSPCAALPILRQALVMLLSGKQVTEVRLGDQVMRYGLANIKELRAEIRKLEQYCTDSGTPKAIRGQAVVVGPRRVGPWVGPNGF
jgi:hypothetical protein